jgi:hypothetical protein
VSENPFSALLNLQKDGRVCEFFGSRAGNQPDFRTISDFRKLHLKGLEALFRQMLSLALETGTMKLGQVALGATTIPHICS